MQREKNRKPVVSQYLRSALPVRLVTSDFRTCDISKHLVNTKVSFHNGHVVDRPVTKENATQRPGLLRLNSQGESSGHDWIHDSPSTNNTSSAKVQTLSLFSDIFRYYMDVSEDRLTTPRGEMSKPMKPCNSSLNVSAAVKRFCQLNNVHSQSHQQKWTTGSLNVVGMSALHPCHDWSQFLSSSKSEHKVLQHVDRKPMEFVSSLQPAEHRTSYCEELQYDCSTLLLDVRSLIFLPVPFVVDLTGCESALKHCRQNEDFLNQLVVIFRNNETVSNACAEDTRFLCRQSRWPRFNCRRKWLNVYRPRTRYRKPPSRSCSSLTAAIRESASDCESPVLYSDLCSSEYSICESKLMSTGENCGMMQQFFPLSDDSLASHMPDSGVWMNSCYSELTLPSLCGLQESCSLASSLFISGKDLDSSDSHCTDSDDSDCVEFFLPSSACMTADIVPESLLPGLPCLYDQFSHNWMCGFGNCTEYTSYGSDCEVYFDEDSTCLVSSDDAAVDSYSGRVKEANVRWDKAYSFPADAFLRSPRHHKRLV